MVEKLKSKRELEEIEVKKIFEDILNLEKKYSNLNLFERAVGRYKLMKVNKRAAEKEIIEAERKLAEVKRKYGK